MSSFPNSHSKHCRSTCGQKIIHIIYVKRFVQVCGRQKFHPNDSLYLTIWLLICFRYFPTIPNFFSTIFCVCTMQHKLSSLLVYTYTLFNWECTCIKMSVWVFVAIFLYVSCIMFLLYKLHCEEEKPLTFCGCHGHIISAIAINVVLWLTLLYLGWLRHFGQKTCIERNPFYTSAQLPLYQQMQSTFSVPFHFFIEISQALTE